MSTAPAVILDSSDEETITNIIGRVNRGESTYEWIETSLTKSKDAQLEIELERIGAEETAEIILSFVVLVSDSYFKSRHNESPPNLLSDIDPQMDELEANLETILSKHFGHSSNLAFERSNSYNGEDTAYVASVVSSVE